MTNTYGGFIRSQRELRDISQGEMAKRIGISRPSYVAVEKGTKDLTLDEAEKLSAVFGITVDELLRTQAPDYKKYKEMILAYLRDAKKSGIVLKKTKLAKLLYLADFAWYYKHMESMSGMPYRKIEFGPVPDAYFRALQELEDEGSVVVKHTEKDGRDMYAISETRASEKNKLNSISTDESKLIHGVWKKWKDANTQEIVKFTHDQVPYTFSFDGEIIPYELITQEDPDHVY